MSGLDYIPRYKDGSDVDSEDTKLVSEPSPTATPAVAKPVASKGPYALPTPTGTVGVDEGILERMQQMIAEREKQKGSFMESLRDAQAWWTGGVAGPSEALARRAKEREEFDATTFGMRRDIAQYRVAQEQAKALDKQVFGTPQPIPTTAEPQAGAAGAVQPQAGGVEAPSQTGGLLNLVKDPALRQSIAVIYSKNRDEGLKAINSYLAKNAEDTEMMKNVRYMVNNKMIDPNLLPAAVLTKFVGPSALVPHDVRTVGGTMQTTPLAAAGPLTPPTAGAPRVAAPAAAAPTPAAAGPAPAAAPTTTAQKPAPSGAAAGPQPIPQVQPLPRVGAPAAAAPAPAATGAGGFDPVSKEAFEIRKEAVGTELQETAKDISKDRAATVEAGSNAGERLASIQYLNNLITTNPRAFGVLQKRGVVPALLTIAEEGANIGNLGAVGVAGISNAVRKAMPGAERSDIIAAEKAAQQFALMQLAAAKIYLKGQGAVSEAERVLVRQLTGSVGNSPEAIRDFLAWNEMRADFDKKNGRAYKEFNTKNPNVSFERYKETPEYQRLKDEYENKISRFAQSGAAPQTDLKSHPAVKLLDKYPQR